MVFWGVGRVVTATPRIVPPPPSLVTTASQTSHWNRPLWGTAMVTAMVTAVHRPIFLEAQVFRGLGWVVTTTLGAVPSQPVQCLHWMTIGGAPPPYVRCHTDVSGDLTESCSKGVTTLFACGLINRGCGRPWPLYWHLIHLCTPFGS